MILRFFLSILYRVLKVVVLLYQAVYFPFTTFKHRERLDFKGPGIVIANHPNTMVDPLNVISRTPRESFFLANAGMFKNPVAGFLLRHLYCIPIMRPGKDTGVKVNNRASFAAAFEHLGGGGVLYIAPEGGSELERHLRPFKTGTARIALGAEAEHDFQLGVHLYPVGLNYDHPTRCGSGLYMEAGEPIRVADWRDAYAHDPIQAAKDLTRLLEDRTRPLVIDTEDDEQDTLLHRLESIQAHDAPLTTAAHYARTQTLLARLKELAAQAPEAYRKLVAGAEAYYAELKANGITDRGVARRHATLWTPAVLLGWPLWLYGRVNNFPPYEIPRLIARKVDLYAGYLSTVKILTGVVTFPLFYWLQYELVARLAGEWYAGWYLLSLPVSGILAWLYARHFQPRWEGRRYRRWKRNNQASAAKLEAMRGELVP